MSILLLNFALLGSITLNDDFFLYQGVTNYVQQYSVFRDLPEGTVGFRAEFLLFDNWFLGGTCTTAVTPGNWSFSVQSIYSVFNIGYRNELLEVGFRHGCSHPVYAYVRAHWSHVPDSDIEGSFDELYIEIKGKLSLIK